ncbi:MAG: hypothetical protein M5R40_20110 [Anaerolineae bacterium]|nr:hypothetical protein [Anaerolineae bacterium]
MSVDLLGENRTFLTNGAVIEVEGQNAQGTPVVRDEEIRFGTENHPSLSPNGMQLAFSGFRAGTFVPQIWVIMLDPETPRATQITDNEFLNTWPIWSPRRAAPDLRDRPARPGRRGPAHRARRWERRRQPDVRR